MASSKYHLYYDKIYAQKDYQNEVDRILSAYSKYSRYPLKRVLDIGCGTGNHSICLAKQGYYVLGVDTDSEMIKIALKKMNSFSGYKLKFLCDNIGNIDEGRFQLAVSLFNVVNYIENLDKLLKFFKHINDRLIRGGIYIFDSWNGIAAIVDPPLDKQNEVKLRDGKILSINLRAKTNIFEQITRIENIILVKDYDIIDKFSYSYNHYLWTPKFLRESLVIAGFKVLRICKIYDLDSNATEKDWKIMFISKKK